MELRVLGSLEVIVAGVEINLRPKEAELLCGLAVNPGRSVQDIQLIDALWGEPPPPSAAKSLQAHVARLRAAVGVDRIERTRDGYRLVMADIRLDAALFEQLAVEGAELDEMRAAVAMLRGSPFAELHLWPPAVVARSRLLEVHAALEERVGELLITGTGARQAIPELDRLAHAHPLRERRWALLAVALAADGRSVEALRTVQDARKQLQESGLDIGPELMRVEREILDGKVTSSTPLVDISPASIPTPRPRPAPPVRPPGSARNSRLMWLLVPLLLLSSGVGGWLAIAGSGDRKPPDALAVTPTVPPDAATTRSSTTDSSTTHSSTAVASTAPAPSAQAARLTDVPCAGLLGLAAAPSDRQGPLRDDTECFALAVPQRRDDSTGPDVLLDVALQPGVSRSALPVVAVGDFRTLATPAPGAHLVVAIRGGAGSDPHIECPEFVDPVALALGPRGPSPDALVEPAAACAQRLEAEGIDVDAFGSADAADDIADLAELFGYEQIQLQVADGVGTWIAQRLIERHDGLVASLLLQDPVAVGQVVSDHIPTTLAAAWRQYVALCAADSACASAYPELDSDWTAFVSSVEESPRTVLVNTAESPTGIDLVVGDAVLQTALTHALDIPAILPLLAGLVHAGDADIVGAFVGGAVLPRAPTLTSQAGFWCTEVWPYRNPAEAAAHVQLSPRFGQAQRWTQMELGLCAVWPHAAPSAAPSAPDVPTLITRGQLSPYLDPVWASELRRVLPDQRSLDLSSVTFGTNANTPPCLADVLMAWWSTQAVESDALDECIGDSPPLTFAIG